MILRFITIPSGTQSFFSAWYNFLVPRIVARSRHIFTVSETIKEEIRRCYSVPSGKITVTYNGLAQDILESGGQGNVQKEKIILSVGSFNLRKNHHSLVNAFLESDLKQTWQLIIVGDRNKVFRETGLNEDISQSNNVKILQKLNDVELIRLYQKAGMLVSLSAYEGFGIPVAEGVFLTARLYVPISLFTGNYSAILQHFVTRLISAA